MANADAAELQPKVADTATKTGVFGSEAGSFLPMPERRIKTPLIKAKSTSIAEALANICNDEQGLLWRAKQAQAKDSQPLRRQPEAPALADAGWRTVAR